MKPKKGNEKGNFNKKMKNSLTDSQLRFRRKKLIKRCDQWIE